MCAVAASWALAAALAAAAPVLHAERDCLLRFTYGWDAAVEEEPALRALLEEGRREARAQARREAEEDRAARQPDGLPFTPHSYSNVWEVAGTAPPLLSLTAQTETYTGGAHGNLTLAALLWDKAADRVADLRAILGAEAMARIRPRFCDALDAMRAERRGEPVRRDPDDDFTACPTLPDQAIAPADLDGDDRFDTLRVLIPPYVAGPWVEGPYIVELPFAATDLSGLPERYRGSFASGDSPPAAAGDAHAD